MRILQCKITVVEIGESEEFSVDDGDISVNQCLPEVGLFRLWVLFWMLCDFVLIGRDVVRFGRRRSRRN